MLPWSAELLLIAPHCTTFVTHQVLLRPAPAPHRHPMLANHPVGADAPGPRRSNAPGWQGVDETWPATGVAGSAYSRDEAMVDAFQSANPEVRVVRLGRAWCPNARRRRR